MSGPRESPAAVETGYLTATFDSVYNEAGERPSSDGLLRPALNDRPCDSSHARNCNH